MIWWGLVVGIFSSNKGHFSACVSLQGKHYTCVLSKRDGSFTDVIYANVFDKKEIQETFMPVLQQRRNKTELTLVLDPADYRFIVIDRPNVRSSKLYKSVRWELSNYMEEDPNLYEYQIYSPTRQADKLIVFLLEKKLLLEYRDFANTVLKMPLHTITIPELALEKLIIKAELQEENALAFVQQFDNFFMLIFMVDNSLQAVYMLPSTDKKSLEKLAAQVAQTITNMKKNIGIEIDTIHWNIKKSLFDLISESANLAKLNHQKFEPSLTEVLVEKDQLFRVAVAVGGGF